MEIREEDEEFEDFSEFQDFGNFGDERKDELVRVILRVLGDFGVEREEEEYGYGGWWIPSI